MPSPAAGAASRSASDPACPEQPAWLPFFSWGTREQYCTLRRGPYLRTLPASQLQAHCWRHNALAGMKQQPAQRTSTHNALARPVAPLVAKATLPLLRNSTPHAAGTPPHLGPSVLLFLACCSCLSLCCLAGFLYLGVCVSRLAVGAWFLYPAKRRHGVLATLPIRSAFCFVCLLVLH